MLYLFTILVDLVLIPNLFYGQELRYQEIYSVSAAKPNAIFLSDHTISIAEGCDDGGPYCCFKEVILSTYAFKKEGVVYTIGIMPKEELCWQGAKLSCQGTDDSALFNKPTIDYQQEYEVLGKKYKAEIKREEYDEKSHTGKYLLKVYKDNTILIEETYGPGETMYGGAVYIADFDSDDVPEIVFYYVSGSGTMLALNVTLYTANQCRYKNLDTNPALEPWENETHCHYAKRVADRYPKRTIDYGCANKSKKVKR